MCIFSPKFLRMQWAGLQPEQLHVDACLYACNVRLCVDETCGTMREVIVWLLDKTEKTSVGNQQCVSAGKSIAPISGELGSKFLNASA